MTGAESAPLKEVKTKGVFLDGEAMKAKIRAAALKPVYDVTNFYKKTGMWQAIARSNIFERSTLFVITFNAIWIAIDTDENQAEVLTNAAPVFQIMEHFFCLYFSLEWLIRFMSFEKKYNGLRDAWFVFDSALVTFMVLETWVMTSFLLFAGGEGSMGGNISILRIARLLRLSRMARMARLFRAMPELLILIKGMAAAMRSVFFTLCLLAIVLYVYGVFFTQVLSDYPRTHLRFGTVSRSIHTLLLDGTLLDNPGIVVKILEEESVIFAAFFYTFILMSALTVMNMLIGVLCEVVSAVAASERETIAVQLMRMRLEKAWFRAVGEEIDSSHTINKEEFTKMLEDKEACRALEDSGVDPIGLVDNIDFMFAGDGDEEDSKEKEFSFADFVQLVLTLRGTNTATVKDIVDLRKHVNSSMQALKHELRSVLGTKTGRKQTIFAVDATKTCVPNTGSSAGDRTLPVAEMSPEEVKSLGPKVAGNEVAMLAPLKSLKKVDESHVPAISVNSMATLKLDLEERVSSAACTLAAQTVDRCEIRKTMAAKPGSALETASATPTVAFVDLAPKSKLQQVSRGSMLSDTSASTSHGADSGGRCASIPENRGVVEPFVSGRGSKCVEEAMAASSIGSGHDGDLEMNAPPQAVMTKTRRNTKTKVRLGRVKESRGSLFD